MCMRFIVLGGKSICKEKMKPKSEERQHFFEKTVSRGVLDMKFMKRTKNKVADFKEKQKINKISDNVINKFRDNITLSGSSKIMYTSGNSGIKNEKSIRHISYIFEDSYVKLQDLSFGRKSFKGFNQEVEKLMTFYNNLKNEKQEEEDFDHMEKKDINDKEFVNIMGSNKLKRMFSKKEKKQKK